VTGAKGKHVFGKAKVPVLRKRTGFRGPPEARVATQFRKGQSGNPGGRPRKLSTLLSDAIRAELGEIDPQTKMTYAAVIGSGLVKTVSKRVKEGLLTKEIMAFLKEAADRTEGRPAQRIELGGVIDANPVERTKELLARALERATGQSE
jgi:hypothetical protein